MGTHHFNSRPHGGRPSTCRHWLSGLLFQLTPSRRATNLLLVFELRFFISTHALTEGDEALNLLAIELEEISTHALTEGDTRRYNPKQPGDISTHALTEGDFCTGFDSSCLNRFQLTPSRRATWFENLGIVHTLHFNSRPHGGRLFFDFRCRS